MTTYAYYPGCSLTESAKEFDISTRRVMEALGVKIQEIDGWTCCGASAVESVSRTLTYALPARNMALSQAQMQGLDILIPCSACYLNHLRVQKDVIPDRAELESVNGLLQAEGLTLSAHGGRVRHLLDVLLNDIAIKVIKNAVVAPINAVIAPYYGCQILRPYPDFDDPERPSSMEPILKALGADILDWDMGGKCCGASLMATKQDVALTAVGRILNAAQGADAIVTVCPMCQMNLETYQPEAVRGGFATAKRPVIYLTQLIGLAMGFSEEDMLLGRNLAPKARFGPKQEEPVAEASGTTEPGNTKT